MNASVPAEQAPLVQVKDLDVRFPLPGGKTVQACDKVTFDVRERETVGLVGESGSGKTTVGRCLVRLVQPSAGQIWFDGNRVDNLSLKAFRPYRKKVQIVFQEAFDSLDPRQRVAQVLEEPLRLYGMSDKRQRSAQVSQLLDQVGLPSVLRSSHPAELSAGDQQRVAIARALATEPTFIVLDEPTSNLAVDAESDIIDLLQRLQREFSLSYLFISHDLSLVRHFCDRVAVMYLSQVVEMGPKEDLFGGALHPYSQALLQSVLVADPSLRRQRREGRLQLAGEIPSPIDLPQGCYLASRCPLVAERCGEERQELLTVDAEHAARCWRAAEDRDGLARSFALGTAVSSSPDQSAADR